MAVALVVFQDRHFGLGDDAADQAFAAAGDGQVDEVGEREQLADGRAVGRWERAERQASGRPHGSEFDRRGCDAKHGWCGWLPCRRGG